MPERNEVIAGRYRLLAVAGRGAAGVVWRARDERLDRVVAVKFPVSGDVERVVREGRVAARLRHPHAISVHDVVDHGGRPCLVLEYLPSRPLADLLDAGPLPEALVAGVGWQVASALAAAHAEGVVHRDVSPSNVLLTDDGTAKITDFGIARALGEGTLTDGRAVVGTPAFLAPEVAAGRGAVFASDVYSLGATLYAALEGHPPCGTAPVRSPGLLADVLGLLLSRDPAERPTMPEVCALLDAVVTREPEDPPPPRGDTRPLTVPRRRSWRGLAAIVGATALVAGGITIGLTWPSAEPDDNARPDPPTTVAANADCTARFEVTNSWPGGYQAEVTVRNAGDRALVDWTVTWPQEAGHAISNLWNGTVTTDAGEVTVANLGHNARLPVAGSTTFGFTANGPTTPRPDVTCTSRP